MIPRSLPRHLCPWPRLLRAKCRNREEDRAIFNPPREILRRRWNPCRTLLNLRRVWSIIWQAFLTTLNRMALTQPLTQPCIRAMAFYLHLYPTKLPQMDPAAVPRNLSPHQWLLMVEVLAALESLMHSRHSILSSMGMGARRVNLLAGTTCPT